MQKLQVQNAGVRYGKKRVFAGVSFELGAGEVLCLLGPSGGGKTTLLNLLAGLVQPFEGEVRMDGALLSNARRAVPPQKRGVALAFQTPALFPHMSIAANLRFAAPGAGEGELGALCEALGIADILDSRPGEISGGQAKRAELARALAAKPQVLLLDEPTAHLDPALRDETTGVILDVAKRQGAAVVYVTHDAAEQERLGARTLRMEGGRLLDG